MKIEGKTKNNTRVCVLSLLRQYHAGCIINTKGDLYLTFVFLNPDLSIATLSCQSLISIITGDVWRTMQKVLLRQVHLLQLAALAHWLFWHHCKSLEEVLVGRVSLKFHLRGHGQRLVIEIFVVRLQFVLLELRFVA